MRGVVKRSQVNRMNSEQVVAEAGSDRALCWNLIASLQLIAPLDNPLLT